MVPSVGLTKTSQNASGQVAPNVQERLVYQLLRLAARVAAYFGFPLKVVGDWLQMAYFHELRERGLKLQDIADGLQISISKAALLSKRLKTNFMQGEDRVALPRQIEFLLWAEPLSQAKIEQALGDSATSEQVGRALRRLVREERVLSKDEGRRVVYVRTKQNSRLVSEDVESRLDAMDGLAVNVANAFAHVFEDGRRDVFTRTVNFYANKKDLSELEAVYREHVWPKILELEERAAGNKSAQAFDLSLLWAPAEENDNGVEDE